MLNTLISEFIYKMDSVPVPEGTDVVKRQSYLAKGGVFVYDNVNNEEEFLIRYTIDNGDVLCIREEYYNLFDSYSYFDYCGKIRGQIPISFFSFRGIRIMLMSMRKAGSVPRVKKEDKFEDIDFLNLINDKNHVYNGDLKYDDYLFYIRSKFSKIEIIRAYRQYLSKWAEFVKISAMTYSDPREFALPFDKQFGYYYEAFEKAYIQNPGCRFLIYNDGCGIGSICATMLGAEYVSFEPYGIGSIACGLGIITYPHSVNLFQDSGENDIFFLGNLSGYMRLTPFLNRKYIVIDENRLFFGCNVKDIKWSTHGRLHTNCIYGDAFVTFGKEFSKSLPMIKDQKNVPMGGKAEFFLLANNLQVYTDGYVETFTESKLGGDHYIDTTDSVRGLVSQNPAFCSYDILNIINRNRVISAYGKLGDIKHVGAVEYDYGVNNFVVLDNTAFVPKYKKYSDPRCLRDWHFQDGLYFGKTANTLRVRYLMDGERSVPLMFMRTIKVGEQVFSIYRDRGAALSVCVDVL